MRGTAPRDAPDGLVDKKRSVSPPRFRVKRFRLRLGGKLEMKSRVPIRSISGFGWEKEAIGIASSGIIESYAAKDIRAMLNSVEQMVRRFFRETADPLDKFYNEASLQHELALFLRRQLPTGWRLHIERPASWFHESAKGLTKKEIDLAVADVAGDRVDAERLHERLLVMSWFRTHPEAWRRTSPLDQRD